jgi:predicted nucleic acid-binding protein
MGLNPLRVYFDSCIAICLVEEHPTFAPMVETRLANQANAASVVIQVSELTEMECLVMPLRQRNQPLLDKYRQWFEKVEVLPVGRAAFRQAAQLRADFAGLKTPDAIHLATALHHGCDEFWTNDNRLNHIAPSFVKNILIP